ncbi:hypothetical protein MmTuc01_1297 [Methanosarcina mazei Tuc01]|uniref:Uncharacterized protein n=1 Tax=Methanosarcina mazei Tuc01 TaxID=1236903 RepID=M1Q8Z9_METMZ|nr:hypothetical protein MmTuc01_1297 [Methanosarcina mazei Tuc01]
MKFEEDIIFLIVLLIIFDLKPCRKNFSMKFEEDIIFL